MIEWVLPLHRKNQHTFFLSVLTIIHDLLSVLPMILVSIVHNVCQYYPWSLSEFSTIPLSIVLDLCQYCPWSLSELSMISISIIHDLGQYCPWNWYSLVSDKLHFWAQWSWRTKQLKTVKKYEESVQAGFMNHYVGNRVPVNGVFQ